MAISIKHVSTNGTWSTVSLVSIAYKQILAVGQHFNEMSVYECASNKVGNDCSSTQLGLKLPWLLVLCRVIFMAPLGDRCRIFLFMHFV